MPRATGVGTGVLPRVRRSIGRSDVPLWLAAPVELGRPFPRRRGRGARRGSCCNCSDRWRRGQSDDRDGHRWIRNRTRVDHRRVTRRCVRRRGVAGRRGRLDDRTGLVAANRWSTCGSRARTRCASEGTSASWHPRLVAVREPSPRLLGRVLGRVRDRGGGDERARDRSTAISVGDGQTHRALTARCLCWRRRGVTL